MKHYLDDFTNDSGLHFEIRVDEKMCQVKETDDGRRQLARGEALTMWDWRDKSADANNNFFTFDSGLFVLICILSIASSVYDEKCGDRKSMRNCDIQSFLLMKIYSELLNFIHSIAQILFHWTVGVNKKLNDFLIDSSIGSSALNYPINSTIIQQIHGSWPFQSIKIGAGSPRASKASTISKQCTEWDFSTQFWSSFVISPSKVWYRKWTGRKWHCRLLSPIQFWWECVHFTLTSSSC